MIKHTYLLASAVLLSVVVAPFALAAGEGGPLRGGARNPSDNQSQALTSETQFIADTSTYGTRQSNKSNNGGGAIYGCRSAAGGSPKGNEPCIRANNLSSGYAFEFATGGALGGTITTSGGDGAKPFTTNATGVATGLNADRLDSKTAAAITSDASKTATADATKAAVGASQVAHPFAQISANGTAGSTRGVVSGPAVSRQGVGNYGVVFAGDLSACAFSAVVLGTDAGEVTVTPTVAGDKKTTALDVRTFTFSAAGTPPTLAIVPADRDVHVSADC
jgi:hypothetical protein